MLETQHHFAVEWLRLYGDKLYAYALSRTGGNGPLAEDLVQDALLAGIQAHARFKEESTLETWLIGILRRKIVDHFRKAYRNPERAMHDLIEEQASDASHAGRGGDWGADAAKACESKEFVEVFDRCLADLNPQLAEAFTLVVMDGLATEDACKLLGITPTNLSVRLHRARLGLRKLLQSRWFEGK